MLPNESLSQANPGYEIRDTNVRVVIVFMVALTLFLMVCQAGLWAMLKGLSGGAADPRAALHMPAMADDEYLKLRARENAILGKSDWVDKTAGKVRIPIGRAIELLSERGLAPMGTGKTEAQMNSHSGLAALAEPVEGVKK